MPVARALYSLTPSRAVHRDDAEVGRSFEEAFELVAGLADVQILQI